MLANPTAAFERYLREKELFVEHTSHTQLDSFFHLRRRKSNWQCPLGERPSYRQIENMTRREIRELVKYYHLLSTFG